MKPGGDDGTRVTCGRGWKGDIGGRRVGNRRCWDRYRRRPGGQRTQCGCGGRHNHRIRLGATGWDDGDGSRDRGKGGG